MLADFFAGMQVAIAARGFTGPVQLGSRYLSGQTSPTAGRVVCVLGRETVGPTTRVGDNPRSRLTRYGALSIHCWGPAAFGTTGALDDVQSLRNAEALVQTVANAARDIATGTLLISEIDWTPSEEIGVVKAGYLAIMQLAVEIPIVDVTYPMSPTGVGQPVVNAWNHYLPPVGATGATGPSCGTPSP
jgi:hypothetical protein